MADNFAVKLGVSLDQTQFAAVQAKLKTLSTTVTLKGGTQQTITKLGDSYGNLYTAITKTNAATGQSTTAFTKLQSAVSGTNQGFTDIIGKVFKFGAATAVIGAFTSAITESVQAVFDLNDALTDFRKVSDLSGESLNSYVSQLSDLGDTVARTTTEMVQNATIFKQAGYSDEDSAKLAQLAAMYQNVADSEISAQEAGSFIVSQMKAYNLTADNAITILDQLNRVSNEYAVSSSDIATGLTKGASAMSALGNSSQETIGLLTAGAEQLTGQSSKVIKGLQTIGINLANAAKKSDTLSVSVRGAQKEIQLFGENGDILSTYDILKQVAGYWDDMTDAEKTNFAATYAGKTRFDVMNAVLGNFGDAIKATQTALDSAGSATQENAKYMDSLQAHLTSLKKEFQELATNTINSQFIKSILDAGTAILKFANSDVGSTIIKMTALGGAFALVGTKIAAGLISPLTILATTLAAIWPYLLGAGIIAGAAYLVDQSADSVSSLNKNISDTTSQITTVKAKIDELKQQGASDNVIDIYQKKLDSLSKQLDEFNKKKFDLLFSKTTTQDYGVDAAGMVISDEVPTKLQKLIDKWHQYKKAQDEALKNGDLDAFQKGQENIDKVENSLSEYETTMFSAVDSGQQLSNEQIQLYADLAEVAGNSQEAAKAHLMLGVAQITASQDTGAIIKSLTQEASQAGLTKDQIWSVTAQSIIFSNTNLDVSQKIAALKLLGSVAYATAAALANVFAAQRISQGDTLSEVSKSATYQAIMGLAKPITTADYGIKNTGSGGGGGGGGSGGGGGGGSSTKQTDTQLEALKNIVSLRQSELDLMKERGDDESLQIAKMRQIQAALHTQADYLRKTKGSQEDINKLSQQWWQIQNSIDDTEQDIYKKQLEAKKKQLELDKKELEAQKESLETQKEQLELQQDKYDKTVSYVTKLIDKQIEALQDESDAIKNNADTYIDEINNKKEAIESEYTLETNSITETNDALDDQLALQEKLEALAKAKSQKKLVYKDGKFQYTQDIDAVSAAQSELDQLTREQELKKQTKSIEEAKDAQIDALDEQIKAIEKNRDDQIKALDAEINAWEEYKDKWSSVADDYEYSQNALIAQEILGADAESQILSQRLDTLQSFASSYADVMTQIADVTSQINSVSAQIDEKSDEISDAEDEEDSDEMSDEKIKALMAANSAAWFKATTKAEKDALHAENVRLNNLLKHKGTYSGGTWSFANGTTDAAGGLSMVGEQGREMRVLNKGDGIIPHQETENLMSLARFSPSQWLNLARGSTNSTSFSIANLTLPNVKDAESFVDGLKNYALQYNAQRT